MTRPIPRSITRAIFPAVLPIVAAAGLAMGGGDAKAITIRYDFPGSPSGYTGGTIEVGSLDQTLGTGPVTFTVEVNGATYSVTANTTYFTTPNDDKLNEISFFSLTQVGQTLVPSSWTAKDFNFGIIRSTTTWRSLLGTFTGTINGFGSFEWANLGAGGSITPTAPTSITFSATDVPGPLPALGAAAAFGWSRRLRKRIQAAPQPAARH